MVLKKDKAVLDLKLPTNCLERQTYNTTHNNARGFVVCLRWPPISPQTKKKLSASHVLPCPRLSCLVLALITFLFITH